MNEGQVLALRVAEEVERRADSYNQGHHVHKGGRHACGAPACVAAITCYMVLHDKYPQRSEDTLLSDLFRRRRWLVGADDESKEMSLPGMARDALGLDGDGRVKMFQPEPYGPGKGCTPREAAGMLRHYAKTGLVEWPARRGAGEEAAAGA